MTRGDLQSARDAHAAHDWATAFDLFAAVADPESLTASDWHAMAESAWWQGRIDACLDAFESAYRRFMDDGEPAHAALSAFYLALHAMGRGDATRGNAWMTRVRQLTADHPESSAHGYLLYFDTFSALGGGDFEAALDLARKMESLGRRLPDPNVAALGVLARGRTLVKNGSVDAGVTLLDEAMLEALSGALDPAWSGAIYCHLMDVCHELADVRRAVEWTLAANSWCEEIPDHNLYPGICRVHRAQVMQIRGDWAAAAAEADRAYRDMLGVHVGTAAGAQYELAEVSRLRGDFSGAEKAFKRAHELGRDPQPGLALVRLAQGRVDVASASIRSALAGTTAQLQRAPLRIAQVEIALAAGDLDAAEDAASELERTAATYASSGLQAAAYGARGCVLQARGQTGEALVQLREACRRWQDIEAPYEAARVRLQLAEAYHLLGDGEAAALELDVAEKVFERLGAAWDSRVVAAMRGGSRATAGLSPREVEVLRLMASGHSNREIASELFLSERTVHRHVSNIFAKLDVSSRAAATAAAYESGLARPGSG